MDTNEDAWDAIRALGYAIIASTGPEFSPGQVLPAGRRFGGDWPGMVAVLESSPWIVIGEATDEEIAALTRLTGPLYFRGKAYRVEIAD